MQEITHPYRTPAAPTVVLMGVLLFLGYVVLLVTVPYYVPLDPSVASAASARGYNTSVAYFAAAGWTLAGLAVFFVVGRLAKRREQTNDQPQYGFSPRRQVGWRHALEIGVVFTAFFLLYCPIFLAKYGPYREDNIFLNLALRMQCGQIPYRDFEFLYGPLMLYPLHAWTNMFGFSLVSYYSFLALVEGLQFAILMVVLQRLVPSPLRRYAAFLILLPFLYDTLLGLNWTALRRLLPVFILFLATSRPHVWGRAVSAGVLLGGQLALSHDYGVAALAALIGVFALNAVCGRRGSVRNALTIVALSIAVWFGIAKLLLRESFGSYVQTVLYLVGRYNLGEGGFEFYWTVNSLAFFGLLTLGVVLVGLRLARFRSETSNASVLTLVASLLYALVALKSGLNRSDVWHLSAPFLPLVFCLVTGARTLRLTRATSVVATGLIIVAGATYLVGSYPSGRAYARGLVKGMIDTVRRAGSARGTARRTRMTALEVERSQPSPEMLRLTEFVANDANRNRPVIFYGSTWALAKQIGVCKDDYLNDDFLYSEERGLDLRDYLEGHANALILIHRPTYERLYELADPSVFPELKWVRVDGPGSWLASVHLRNLEIEHFVREQRWKRTVGEYVRAHYHFVEEFGGVVVLDRISAPAGD